MYPEAPGIGPNKGGAKKKLESYTLGMEHASFIDIYR
jgi:hypothetical protein